MDSSNGNPVNQLENQPNLQQKSNKGLICLTIVSLILAVAGVGFGVYAMMNKDKSEGTPTPEPVATEDPMTVKDAEVTTVSCCPIQPGKAAEVNVTRNFLVGRSSFSWTTWSSVTTAHGLSCVLATSVQPFSCSAETTSSPVTRSRSVRKTKNRGCQAKA